MKHRFTSSALAALAGVVSGCGVLIDIDGTYVEVACVPGSRRPCYGGPEGTEGIGACRAGTATCTADGAGYGPCEGEVTPRCEDCSTPEDESCDGRASCQGALLWSKQLGIPGSRYLWALEVGADGGIVLAGSFAGDIDFGGGALASAGDCDTFLAKLDASGNHLWSKRFGDGDDNCGPVRVALGPEGNILFSGSFRGTIDLGGGPLTSTGGDGFVAVLDGAGEHLWSKRVGDSTDAKSTEDIHGVFLSPGGDVALVGVFEDTVDLGGGPLASGGAHDILIARLDAEGGHVWSQRHGGSSDDYAMRLVADAAGDTVVAARSPGSIDVGGGALAAEGPMSTVIARYDSRGGHLWSKLFGGAGASLGPTALAADASGDLFLHGPLSGTVDFGGGPLTASQGVFFAKLGPAGGHLASIVVDHLWPYAADKPIEGDGMAADCDGNVIARHTVLAPVDLGRGPTISDPVLLVKLDASLQPVWSMGFATTAEVHIDGIGTDPRGNVVVGGIFRGSAAFGGGTLVSDTAAADSLFIAALAP